MIQKRLVNYNHHHHHHRFISHKAAQSQSRWTIC